MSDVSPLKVLVVGAGPMGRHHAGAVLRVSAGLAQLQGFVDPDRSAVDEASDALSVQGFVDLSEALRATEPDVVHVCSPPSTHVQVALASIAAGAHVYVEKPFALSVAEAESVFAAAGAAGRKLAAGHQLLRDAATVAGEEGLRAIGKVRHVESYFAFAQRKEKSGRRPRTPTEQLIDIIPHPSYLLAYFLERGSGEAPTVEWLSAGEDGWAQLAVRSGDATGSLVATLQGRPVDSYVKVVGTRGSMYLDYVRSIAQVTVGTGTTIEKILNPYLQATGLMWGATRSLTGRLLRSERSYPGLRAMFEDFYRSILSDHEPPVSEGNIRFTTTVVEQVAAAIAGTTLPYVPPERDPTVLVTGGSGFLGAHVTRELVGMDETPMVVGRRMPPASARIPGVAYQVADLGEPGDLDVPRGVRVVIHCAAETAGSWDAQQRNSVDASNHVLEAAAAAGVECVVYVSSLGVVSLKSRGAIDEATPTEMDARSRGPYVWGKLAAEQLVVERGRELGVAVRVVRPGPLVDPQDGTPPGRLGRFVGPLYVAVGPKRGQVPTTDVRLAGKVLARSARQWKKLPAVLHLLDPEPPRRRTLVKRLRARRPRTRVFWLPWIVVRFLSGVLVPVQKVLRPSKKAIRLSSAFAAPRYSTDAVARTLAALGLEVSSAEQV